MSEYSLQSQPPPVVNCPEGTVKHEHRAIMFAYLFGIIGIILIVIASMNKNYARCVSFKVQDDDDCDQIYSMIIIGGILLITCTIILFACIISATLKKCFTTALLTLFSLFII